MNAIAPSPPHLHQSSIESPETLWTPKTSVRQPPRAPTTEIEPLRTTLLQSPKTSVLAPRRGFKLHTEDPENGKKQWEFLATSAHAGVPAHSEPQQRVHTESDTRGLLPLPLHTGPNVGPWRRRNSRRRFRIFFLLSLILAVACLVWFKAPSLDKLSKEQDQEDEDDALQVFPLVYKYAEGAGVGANISVPNIMQTLFARDLSRNRDRIPPSTTKGVVRPLLAAVSRHGNASALLPVKGNLFPDGLYYTTIYIGQPQKPYFVDVDSGSDLTWLQCDAPCTSCAQGPHSLYSPNSKGIVSCNDPICAQVTRRTGPDCPEDSRQCDYVFNYVDKSSTMGVLVADALSLQLSNRTFIEKKVIFGCGYDQRGNLATSPAKADGIIGLGSSPASLPSQLAQQGVFKNVVGHCLAGERGGYMFFGDNFLPSSGITWVPMIGKPTAQHYSVELQNVYYGKRGTVASSKHTVIIDSGTSFSFLMPDLFEGFVASVRESLLQTDFVAAVEDDTMSMCWRGATAFSSVADVAKYFKTVTLSFGGVSRWVPMSSKLMVVPPENYLFISARGNLCLGIADARATGVGFSILGDIILRGQLVVYDNVQSRVGWIRGKCVK